MLEQMYLIMVPKISVLGPNCWETSTEFSRYKNRIWMVVSLNLCPFFSEKLLISANLCYKISKLHDGRSF
jgi:hypothetical protein